jgi:hypothetical protein
LLSKLRKLEVKGCTNLQYNFLFAAQIIKNIKITFYPPLIQQDKIYSIP